MAELGPGTGMTRRPSRCAAATSKAPGAEIAGVPASLTRATLCRCGASKNKPFCDGAHHEAGFDATGEPPTGEKTDMLAARDGPLEIFPQADGPLLVKGNLEIVTGTGRVVARMEKAFLCRCGQSANKPFCDGAHKRIGFKTSERH